MVGGAMPSPSPSSPPPGGAAPGGAPGSSPATMPAANRGHEAAGIAQVGQVVRLLERVVPMLGSGNEVGRDVLKAISLLSKHVPPGAMSPGIENNALQQLVTQQRQMGPQIAAMRAAQAPQGAAPPSPAG